MTDGKINNGYRAQVSFGYYQGEAGVVTLRGETTVAFFGDFRRLRSIEHGEIAGVPYRVLDVERSNPDKGGVAGMVRLTVELDN